MGEEDFFSDDDLDGIPDNTLQELEQNAKVLCLHPARKAHCYRIRPSDVCERIALAEGSFGSVDLPLRSVE